MQLHKKIICQQTERVTRDPRPPLETSQKDASNGAGWFCLPPFSLDLFFVTHGKIEHKKSTRANVVRFFETNLAAFSDFSYLARLVGKLILEKIQLLCVILCNTRNTSVFESRTIK